MKSSWLFSVQINLIGLLVLSPLFTSFKLSLARCPNSSAVLADSEQEHLLKQPFFYLGAGQQSVAFLGKDGTTVLKFFFKDHVQEPLMKSAHIAYHYLREETGLIAIHLQPTSKETFVTLFDLSGQSLCLSIKDVPYVIQKKGLPFFPYLEAKCLQKDDFAIKKAISSLMHIFVVAYDKGIVDHDYALRRNSGVLGDDVFLLDIGSFEQPEHVDESKQALLIRKTTRLERWLKKHAPEYLPFYTEELMHQAREQPDESLSNRLNGNGCDHKASQTIDNIHTGMPESSFESRSKVEDNPEYSSH